MIAALQPAQVRLCVHALNPNTSHIYHASERTWESCVAKEKTVNCYPFPDLTLIHEHGPATEYVEFTTTQLESAPICNIVCKLVSVHPNRAALFAILVPSRSVDGSYRSYLLFIACNSKIRDRVHEIYKYACKHKYAGNADLGSGYYAQFPINKKNDLTPLIIYRGLKQFSLTPEKRHQLWRNHLGCAPLHSLEAKVKAGTGWIVELSNIDVHELRGKLGSKLEQEAHLQINSHGYEGGRLRSKPLKSSAEFKSVLLAVKNAAPGTNYIAANQPLSDYHLTQEHVRDKYFQRSYSPRAVLNAVQKLRTVAGDLGMSEGEFQPILGAVMSSFYEDIGWKLAEISPVSDAVISEAAVDVDQVTLHVKNYSADPAGTDDWNYISRQYDWLLDSGIFCANDPSSRSVLLAQKATYSHGAFALKASQGGHTYMDSSVRSQFVRISPDNSSQAVFHVSVRCNDRRSEKDMDHVRAEVWECIVDVAKWWGKKRPGRTKQDILEAEKIAKPGEQFYGHGGPLFPILVALYYGRYCSLKGSGSIDIVCETYGTKSTVACDVADPSQLLTSEDQRPRETSDALKVRLKYLPPYQIINFGSALESDFFTSAVVNIGVGCTISTHAPARSALSNVPPRASVICASPGFVPVATVTPPVTPSEKYMGSFSAANPTDHLASPVEYAFSKVPPLFPVISCCPLPWDKLDPAKFFDESSADRLKPFVPAQHAKHCMTFPVYGNVLPQQLQPSTFSATRKVPNLRDVIMATPGSPELSSEQISRVQQYSVTARHAVGGGSSKTAQSVAQLSKLPVYFSESGRSGYIDTGKCVQQVKDFAKLVKDHFEGNEAEGGGTARIEIAVAYDLQDAPKSVLENAVRDVLTIVQSSTKSYDYQDIYSFTMLLVSALESRMICANEMLKSTTDATVIQELNAVAVDVFGNSKQFFSGKGFQHSKQKTLPRLAYMNDRPILSKVGPACAEVRRKWQTKGGTNFLTLFYNALECAEEDVREIPLFKPEQPLSSRKVTSEVRGMACPLCFARFWPDDRSAYDQHDCPEGAAPHRTWIELSSKAFRRHHSALVSMLSEEQKYLLEALKDDCTANLYLAGIAGTGKSTAMRAAAEACCMNFGMSAVAILAPTHVAAKNVGGQTIASFLGAKPGTYSENAVFYSSRLTSARKNSMQQELRFLFVDEVGMITADDLDRLNEFMCEAMRSTLNQGKTGSFGGLKTVLVGDPLQVPPVKLTKEGFFFQSNAFCAKESQFLVLYLKQGFRTDRAEFLDMQSHCRIGCALPEHMEYANKVFGRAVGTSWQKKTFDHLRELFGKRKGATMDYRISTYFISGERIAASTCVRHSVEDPQAESSHPPFVITLEKEERDFLREKYEESFKEHLTPFTARDQLSGTGRGKCEFILPEIVYLAVNMRVTVLWDKAVPSVCKGTNGIITKLARECATVQIESAGPYTVVVDISRVTERITNANGQLLGSREQIPLAACIAGTHYFVQGQTLDKVPCIYANERVCKGQYGASYTAISRFRQPEYILPLHPLKTTDFAAADAALRFDQYHAQQDHPLTAVNYHYRGMKGVKVTKAPCQCNEVGKIEGCILCWDIEVVKTRAVQWLDKVVHNVPKSTGPAVVSPPPSVVKKAQDGSRLFVNRDIEVYYCAADGGTEGGAFSAMQNISANADNERDVRNASAQSRGSAEPVPGSFDCEQGFGEDAWGGEGGGEILPMDLYWDSIDDIMDWEYGNNASRAVSAPGVEYDAYAGCGGATSCSNYQSNVGIKVWDSAQPQPSNQAARNGANRKKGPPKDSNWLAAGDLPAGNYTHKGAGSKGKARFAVDADAESDWKRKKPRRIYPDLGELNCIGTITLPVEPPLSVDTWDARTAMWLYNAYESIYDTRWKRDKRPRKVARDMLVERGVEMALNAPTVYEYLYYAFCAKFPNERRSLQDLRDCIHGNKHNKNFIAKLVAMSNPHAAHQSADTEDIPVFRDLLISSDKKVYEFAALPSDKQHCLWPRVVLGDKV